MRAEEGLPVGDVVTTYLELTSAAGIRPARPVDVEIVRVDPPDGAINQRFYESVGAEHDWIDHRDKDDAWWQAHAAAVETWIVPEAGYYELELTGDDVLIAHFGLVPAAQGRGLGGHLLTHALRRAFELGSRAWLHTCTLDGPHALANYEARGMVTYRVER